MNAATPPARPLKHYAWLSIAAAIATILLKGVAWKLTGSVGLLSDAIESFVNLAGALMALADADSGERFPPTTIMPTDTARPSIFPAPSRAS